MPKTTQIQVRVEPELKSKAEHILTQLGLSHTEFVRMALSQLVMRQGLPFEAKIPNAETIEAFQEDISSLKGYTDAEEMMKDILAEPSS